MSVCNGVNPERWIYSCSYTLPATKTPGEEDPIHNIATVNAKDEQDQPVPPAQASHDTDLLNPDIQVVKQADAAQAHVGDTVTYTFYTASATPTRSRPSRTTHRRG